MHCPYFKPKEAFAWGGMPKYKIIHVLVPNGLCFWGRWFIRIFIVLSLLLSSLPVCPIIHCNIYISMTFIFCCLCISTYIYLDPSLQNWMELAKTWWTCFKNSTNLLINLPWGAYILIISACVLSFTVAKL